MLQGFFHAVVAACTYGLIALFSVPIMAEGLTFSAINFYRFGSAAFMVMLFVLMRKRSFAILKIAYSDLVKIFAISFFYAMSALSFMASFLYLDTGIAVTVAYCYPIFVVFCMVAFFKEPFQASSVVATALIALGVAIFSLQDLMFGSSGVRISWWGIFLSIVCAVTLAFYVVGIQVAKIRCTNEFVTAMYIMLATSLCCGAYSVFMGEFTLPNSTGQWGELFVLGLITAAISNICLVFAVRLVGPSLTAILGGLEPVTGMLAGVYLLDEQASWGNVIGAACILLAVLLVALASRRQQAQNV